MDKVYDIIVLGAGPAGLAAASYAGRARMDTLLIEGTKDGGQIVITNEIENYPGSHGRRIRPVPDCQNDKTGRKIRC